MPDSAADARSTLDAVLPHRPPFRFVDTVAHLGAEAGDFVLDLGEGDPRLGVNGRFSPLLLLEALAQSAAAFHGLHLRQDDGLAAKAEEGMLVQIDAARLHRAPGPSRVELHIERKQTFGALVRFTGAARANAELLVECELTVARGGGVA